MAYLHFTLIEGRSDSQKAAMFAEVTKAVHTALGTPPAMVRIAIQEIPASHFATAGVSKGMTAAAAKA